MIGIFTVAFFGHRYVDDIIALENLLEKQIYKIISEKEYVDFLVTMKHILTTIPMLKFQTVHQMLILNPQYK